MLPSVNLRAHALVEPTGVAWLRRLLDLGLGGFAFSLGFHVAPAEIFLCVVLVAVLGLQAFGVRVLRRTSLELPLGLYGIAVATGVLASGDPAASLLAPDAWGGYRFAACLVLAGAIGDAARGWRLAQIFVVAVAAQGAFGLAQVALGAAAPASGTYGRSDVLAFVTLASLSLTAGASLAGALAGRTRVAAMLLAVPTGLGQLAALVRAGWAALAAALGTMAVLGRRGGRVALVLLGLLAAGAAGTAALSGPARGAEGLRQHGFAWARTLETISDHPVTGLGVGTLAGQGAAAAGRAHNHLLSVWAESGPLGLVAFVWIVVSVFAALRRGVKRVGDDRRAAALIMGAAGVATGFVVCSATQDPLYDATNAYVLAFCVALGLAAIPRADPAVAAAGEAEGAPPAPRGSAAVAAVSSSLAVLGGLSRLETVGRPDAYAAALLLGLLGAGYLPILPALLAARVRGLATLGGAAVLVARAFSVVADPGTEAWWRTPSALASVGAIAAGMAGSAWAMRRPGEVGPAAVAGAIAAGWVVAWVAGIAYLALPALEVGFDPERDFSFNFALGACAAALLFVAWAGPLGFGEGRVLGYAERLRRLPTAAVALGLLAVLAAGLS